MGNSTTVHKGTIYVACAEKLSGSDILYISFDRQDALDAARRKIASISDGERDNTVFLLSAIETDIHPVDTPDSAYQRLLTKMGASRAAHWAQEGIRDGLTTELRSGGGCCEFYRDNALVLSLSAPYVVGNNGVLTVQDQIKADICRIQRKVNLQGAPLTHRELWHLSDDLAAYYAERDQRNLKKSQAKHRSDRYVTLCQRTEKKKRALISAMIRDGSTEPWDADKIAAKVYVPFMEELYASFPSLVAGATLFERTQMLELLEAYRKPGLPFDGYWQLPPEAQVFTTKGGLYDVV